MFPCCKERVVLTNCCGAFPVARADCWPTATRTRWHRTVWGISRGPFAGRTLIRLTPDAPCWQRFVRYASGDKNVRWETIPISRRLFVLPPKRHRIVFVLGTLLSTVIGNCATPPIGLVRMPTDDCASRRVTSHSPHRARTRRIAVNHQLSFQWVISISRICAFQYRWGDRVSLHLRAWLACTT